MKKWYANRYFILALLLIAWLAFFDKNNLVYQHRLSQEIDALENEGKFYEYEIEKLKAQKYALSSDMDLLETYARERYLMKEEDEDLFLLKEELTK